VTELNPRVSVAFQTDKTLAEYAELGRLAEGYGFGTVSVYSDLMFQPPLPALLSMAAATTRVRLGPACLNPFTVHPVEIAGQMTMLDQASRGRAYLGLARGAWLDSIGVQPKRPLQAIRQAVEVIRRLLTRDAAGFGGEVFSLRPGQQLEYETNGNVPLLIGTWGPKLAALAGELADEVKVGGSANPEMVAAMRNWIAVGSALVRRPAAQVGIILGAVTVVDEDGGRARIRAREEVARYLPVVAPFDPTFAMEPGLFSRVDKLVHQRDFSAAGALIPDDVLARFAFAGTPSEVTAQAASVLAAGAARVEFGTPHGLTAKEGLRLLGEKVLPALH
jgi:5,10-methylenetetrahydromethanopterin reductase